MTTQTKKKLWIGGFLLLPLLVIFLPYQLLQNYIEVNQSSSTLEEDFVLFCFGYYVFHILLAHIQLFLSLRITWLKKETCSEFSCKFHTARFGVTLAFYLICAVAVILSFGFENDSSLELSLNLCFLYFCFCILMTLINLGHWIYTKVPRKPKEEIAKDEFTPFQLEESKTQPSSREYFWELTSLKKWIAVGLVVLVLLGAGYLFGYDLNQPTAAQSNIKKDILSHQFSVLYYNHNIDTQARINNEYFEGIVHYQVFMTQEEQAKEEIRQAKENAFLPHLTTYYNYEDKDLNAEAVISVCQYTPLVKKWGYGWFDNQGNLYADTYGKEQAKTVPNYRRNFCVTIRQESIVWRFNIFTDEPSQTLAIAEVFHHCKTLQ